MERNSLSKKIRFEIFKRDKFTCQYCGRTVPDVVLHIDHIHPVAEGGTNDLINLLTACSDCNLGKGKRLLSDETMIDKQRKQIEELDERREQIELMYEWKKELLNLDQVQLDMASNFWSELLGSNYHLNENGLQIIKKTIRKFGLDEVLESMKISINQYVIVRDGSLDQDSVEIAFDKIARICSIRSSGKQESYYVRGILRKRLQYVNEHVSLATINKAFKSGATFEQLKDIAITSRNWTEWREEMDTLLAILENNHGE